ncbi:MAG: ferredoxin--NADP reductase [Bacteroidota bacterium]
MGIHILKLDDLHWESPDAASLHFKQAAVDRIHFLPGQFLTLKVEIEGSYYFRSYSISSAPRLDDILSITIKRVKGGIVSNYILDHYEAGQLVEFLSPKGRFIIQNSIKEERRLILIAGGSGITPIMSILRSTLFNEPKSKIELLYASRDEKHIIFKDKLDDLLKKFPKRFRLTHFLSQGKEEKAGIIHSRLNPELLEKELNKIVSSFPQLFYLCGPTALMDMAQEVLEKRGIAQEDIHRERFIAEETEIQEQVEFEGPSVGVQVKWGEQSYQVMVPPGSTILRAAIEQGIDLPHSCLRGICATCMGHLKSGQVRMLNNETLLDFEVEAGKVLVCQSQPLDQEVVIEVGKSF